ncbi:uncharacterized protein LOC135488728 [Lineus longissimus]|uniref:uncharacterized protein LOC135488728 n=1 Tax=Lineus longissimus TaxID=88925 RepID=UPI00315D79EA
MYFCHSTEQDKKKGKSTGMRKSKVFFRTVLLVAGTLCVLYMLNSDTLKFRRAPSMLIKTVTAEERLVQYGAGEVAFIDKYRHGLGPKRLASEGPTRGYFDTTVKEMVDWGEITNPTPTPTLGRSILVQKSTTTEPAEITLTSPAPHLPVVYFDADIKRSGGFKYGLGGNITRIPRIIHQTWKTHDVPKQFTDFAKTWVQHNPGWEYWFWSDAEAERFIKFKYPQYYDMYRNYPQNIQRADAMRYFVLYEFGGWYADLDVEDLKPLDDLGKQHNCIISQEPWGHVLFIWHRTRLACNALMAARPKHPYFKYVVEQLPKNARKNKNDPMTTTGPKMIDDTLYEYEKNMKQNNTFIQNETVYLANPDYFLPILSGNGLPDVKRACAHLPNTTSELKKFVCARYEKEKWSNKPLPESYTNHVWIHTYYHADIGKKTNTSIFELVPGTVNVTNVLINMENKYKKQVPESITSQPAWSTPPSTAPRLPVVYFDADIKRSGGLKNDLGGKNARIPRIIHQTWKTHDVPKQFTEYAKTWVQHNPGWEYWFWSDAEAERFIKFKYPQYYDMYRNYPQNIHRADAMRYFILYEFGGWYADLDVEDLKPLDDLGKQHNCIISQEPWGHVLFIWHRTRLACNALMAARPKHPYFKYVVEQLPKNAPKKKDGPMATTGPIMIDRTLYEYEEIMKQNNTFKQNETVYLANPDYFLPKLSGNGLPDVKKACARLPNTTSELKKSVCARYEMENWSNKPLPESYTNHVWIHTYYHADIGKKTNTSIFELVPGTVNVTNVLINLEKEATTT